MHRNESGHALHVPPPSDASSHPYQKDKPAGLGKLGADLWKTAMQSACLTFALPLLRESRLHVVPHVVRVCLMCTSMKPDHSVMVPIHIATA